MKIFLLFVSTILFCLNGHTQSNFISSIPSLKKTTLFQQHIKILDSITCHGYNDPLNLADSSVKFMERITHIPAHGDCQWVVYYFTPFDLALWKNWYKNIGSKRIGQIL